jgi:hypothetical protein
MMMTFQDRVRVEVMYGTTNGIEGSMQRTNTKLHQLH